MPSDHLFDHEKLNVYSKTLDFITWVTVLLERVPKSAAVYNQLDRSSTSMPLNIAEGTANSPPRTDAVTTTPRAVQPSSALRRSMFWLQKEFAKKRYYRGQRNSAADCLDAGRPDQICCAGSGL
jgi:hypothetical protein